MTRRGYVPALARWLLGLAIAATLAVNIAHGLGHWRGPRPWATALARGLRTGSICSSDLRIRNLLNLNLDLRGRLWSRVLDSI